MSSSLIHQCQGGRYLEGYIRINLYLSFYFCTKILIIIMTAKEEKNKSQLANPILMLACSWGQYSNFLFIWPHSSIHNLHKVEFATIVVDVKPGWEIRWVPGATFWFKWPLVQGLFLWTRDHFALAMRHSLVTYWYMYRICMLLYRRYVRDQNQIFKIGPWCIKWHNRELLIILKIRGREKLWWFDWIRF